MTKLIDFSGTIDQSISIDTVVEIGSWASSFVVAIRITRTVLQCLGIAIVIREGAARSFNSLLLR